VRSIGPHVDHDELGIGDSTLGELGDHLRIRTHRLVALVPLVDRRVGLPARSGFPRHELVPGQVDDADEGRALVGPPRDDPRLPLDRIARREGPHQLLGRLVQRYRRDSPGRAGDLAFPPKDRGHGADLVRGQPVERVDGHQTPFWTGLERVSQRSAANGPIIGE
jgi:hypothetical protein